MIRRWRKNTPGRWHGRRGDHEADDQVPLCWSLGFTCTAFNWTDVCSIPTSVWTQPFRKSGSVSVQVCYSKLHLLKQKRFKDFNFFLQEGILVNPYVVCEHHIWQTHRLPFLFLFVRLCCLQNVPVHVRYMLRCGCESSWKPLISPDVASPVRMVYFCWYATGF